MDGSTSRMVVSISAVAASSQFRSPAKDRSIGTNVSIAGNRVMTFSAVTSTRLRSKPVLMSRLLRVA